MGSQGPPVATVHFTGFKKFEGVDDNPTEKIVKNLKDYFAKKELPKGIILGSCTVLDVAGEGALGPLYRILEHSVAQKEMQTLKSEKIIWVHLGVNSGSLTFSIEKQAVNEASFAYPDELGWMPQRMPVILSEGSISRIRKTALPSEDIAMALLGEGYDVRLSDNAGLFVCNYVYYHSLSFAEKHGIQSLFVHVPLFEAIDEQTQMRFMASLLDVIASLQ